MAVARASESDAPGPLTWDDDLELARRLLTRFPDLDPLTLRFPDLVRWVTEMERFHGNAKPESARQLENIQRAWYALYDTAS